MAFQDEKALAVDRRRDIENRFGLRDVRDIVALVDEHLKRRGEFFERKLLAELRRELLPMETAEALLLHCLVEGKESIQRECFL
jgi:hypothetical protein